MWSLKQEWLCLFRLEKARPCRDRITTLFGESLWKWNKLFIVLTPQKQHLKHKSLKKGRFKPHVRKASLLWVIVVQHQGSGSLCRLSSLHQSRLIAGLFSFTKRRKGYLSEMVSKYLVLPWDKKMGAWGNSSLTEQLLEIFKWVVCWSESKVLQKLQPQGSSAVAFCFSILM